MPQQILYTGCRQAMILLQMSGCLVHILLSQVHYRGMRDFALKASIQKYVVFLGQKGTRSHQRRIGDHHPFRVQLDFANFHFVFLDHLIHFGVIIVGNFVSCHQIELREKLLLFLYFRYSSEWLLRRKSNLLQVLL